MGGHQVPGALARLPAASSGGGWRQEGQEGQGQEGDVSARGISLGLRQPRVRMSSGFVSLGLRQPRVRKSSRTAATTARSHAKMLQSGIMHGRHATNPYVFRAGRDFTACGCACQTLSRDVFV